MSRLLFLTLSFATALSLSGGAVPERPCCVGKRPALTSLTPSKKKRIPPSHKSSATTSSEEKKE